MTEKGARPTVRDLKLFRTLFEYGLLSRRQICQWFFEEVEKTTVLRRLRKLEEGHYIRRRGTLGDGTSVFVIASEGVKAIGEEVITTTYPRHQIEHEIEVGNLRHYLERLGAVKSWMTERSLRSEVMKRSRWNDRSQILVPDALILFRHLLKPNAKVALEMELHAKSDQRYKARFQKLEASSVFTWYIVKTESCSNKILNMAARYGRNGSEDCIGVTLLQDLEAKNLDAMIYRPHQICSLKEALNFTATTVPAQAGAQGLSTVNPNNPKAIAA